MTTKTLNIKGMHCVSCSMLIEGELEDLGIEAKANYAKQTAQVTYDEKKISLEKIHQAIKKAGYDVVN